MSAASHANTLVFSVFENDHYNIYASRYVAACDGRRAGHRYRATPPCCRRRIAGRARWNRCCRAAQRGSRSRATTRSATTARNCSSRPSASRPSASASIASARMAAVVFRFCSAISSAIALTGRDDAGSTNRIEETGGQVMYLNRQSRWNWGLIAEHLPYVTGSYGQGLAVINGQPVIVQEQVRVTQLNSGATAVAQYPFSRVQRVEFFARRAANRLCLGSGDAVLLADHRAAVGAAAGGPAASGRNQPGRSVRRPRLRLIDLRRHRPARRAPLPH